MRCWGAGSSPAFFGFGGQASDFTTPAPVPGISDAEQISSSYLHNCALLTGGDVNCWGMNNGGETGDPAFETWSEPTAVAGLADTAQIYAGAARSCALHSAGTVSCWGYGAGVDPDSGEPVNTETPTQVAGVSDATAIASGEGHSCVLLNSGEVKCWGDNSYGQLGDGTTDPSSTPVTVDGISDAVKIAAGMMHSCAVLAGGQIKCWGWGEGGTLGDGTTDNASTPVAVEGIADAVKVTAGYMHSCAVLAGGTVKCWGATDNMGSLGDGTTNASLSPVSVEGITNATKLVTGYAFTCALLGDGEVKCWGWGGYGQLGDGQQPNGHSPLGVRPTTVFGFEAAEQPRRRPTAPVVDTSPQLQLPAPGTGVPTLAKPPAATPPQAPKREAATIVYRSGKVLVRRFELSARKANRAGPRWVTLRIRSAGVRETVTRRVRVKQTAGKLQISTRVVLPADFWNARKLRVTIRGSGLKPITRTVDRS